MTKERSLVFLIFVALVALVLGSISALYGSARTFAIGEAHSEVETTARVVSHRLEGVIFRTNRTMENAIRALQNDFSADHIKRLVDRRYLSMEDLVLLTFVDHEGRTIGTQFGPDLQKTSLEDREHIKVHLERRVEGLYISEPVLGRVSRRWSVQMTRRIDNEDGSTRGVLVASLDPMMFAKLGDYIKFNPSLRTDIVGLDGAIRTRLQGLNVVFDNLPKRPDVVQRAEDDPVRQSVEIENGERRLSFHFRIGALPLVVESSMSEDVALKPLDTMARNYAMLAALMTLILALSACLICRSLSRLRQDRLRLALQAEEMRELADVADRANRAKGSFLAAMSHEIRTPLNAIMGFAGLLSKTNLDAEQRRHIDTVEVNTRHLRTLVNDILDFSRLEAGRLELEVAPFNIEHVWQNACATARVLVGDKPIELALQADEGCRGEFVGDSARMTQVILNLVSNAVKFTQSGRVALRLECAPGDNGATKITATVADTGTGIETELLEKIFTPFDQGNLRGEARRAGTGLGLSISRRLVHLMGGDLVVRSVVGTGSEFRFTVQLQPVAQVKAEAPDSASTSTPPGPLDVLIADDSPASLLLMKILLQKRGHKVTAVTDGAQALDAATAARFDLAVLDLQMPNMGGIEATRRIRRLPPGQGCRFVVALTAEAFAEERRAALEAGMDEVMTKPFEDTEFDEMLKRLLANPDSNPGAIPHSLKSPKAA